MARIFGVDCIVDAAHSWGQMNFDLNDLGADFVGFNLHKWMGAPLGAGVMYIKSTRLADIAPASGDNVWLQEQAASHNDRGFTYKRIHTGTFNYAAWLSVPTALAYRDTIGAELIAARLRYLRHYWTSQVGSHVQVIGSQHVDNFAGIGAFRLNGQTSLAAGSCLRITPALFTSTAELDTLLHALT